MEQDRRGWVNKLAGARASVLPVLGRTLRVDLRLWAGGEEELHGVGAGVAAGVVDFKVEGGNVGERKRHRGEAVLPVGPLRRMPHPSKRGRPFWSNNFGRFRAGWPGRSKRPEPTKRSSRGGVPKHEQQHKHHNIYVRDHAEVNRVEAI